MTATFKPLIFVIATLLTGCTSQPEASFSSNAVAAPSSSDAAQTLDGVTVNTLTTGLRHPWSMAFLPDGGMLITERVGHLLRLTADGQRLATIDGVPPVVAEGQGGLLDVALSPTFAADGLIYLSYAEPGEGDLAGTAVARAKLSDDRLINLEVIFRQSPKVSTRYHFGSRLVFAPSGELFITMGDRGQRPTAQDLHSHMGTIARIWPNGQVPENNPFLGNQDAQPEIWSYGHRNQQGAAINPWTGLLWTHEHGPKGGDEINIPIAGGNYGWPLVTFGIDYSGLPISEAKGTEMEGMQPPLHYWPVSPGISGMAFYNHPAEPAWQNSLFVGSLAQRLLIRLQLEGDRVIAEERMLASLNYRIRDVRVGPDGAIYLLTDDIDGRLLQVLPAR